MKTANELNIQQWEHDALVMLIDWLPRLEHTTDYMNFSSKCAFNMDTGGRDSFCGTVACIGGWAYLLTNPNEPASNASAYVMSYNGVGPLSSLYFPDEITEYYDKHGIETPDTGAWGNITPTQAVQAIKNFLNTGNPKWIEVIETVE